MCSNTNNNNSNGSRSQRNDSLSHSGIDTSATKRNYSSSDASSHQRTTSSTPSKPASK